MTDSEKESMKKQSGGGGKPGVRKGKKCRDTGKKIEKSSWHRIGKKNKVKDGGWGGGGWQKWKKRSKRETER